MRIRLAVVAALLAETLLGSAVPALAQVSGEGTVTGGALQSGGPDVSHQQPFSSDGVWLSGTLSAFEVSKTFDLHWEGIGTPDFRLQGTLFREGWLLEASVVQRAYLVGGDARFAWDPWTGVLDTRVAESLQQYVPLKGSAVGQFNTSALPAARILLPDSSPGWAMRDYALTFRTLGSDRGVEVSVLSNERSGVVPRTFVTATGFAPALTPLTADLPIGAPLGVVEVPDRFSERTLGVEARAFILVGAWRWEGSASAERYEFRRLITDWASPFPGPDIREPAAFRGTQALLRVSGRGPNGSFSVERTEQWGRGDAGERQTGVTRIRADFRHKVAGGTWFLKALVAHRDDRASLEPAGPHPVFQGPYYDLLGPRLASAPLRAYPTTDAWIEGGLQSKRFEVSGRLRQFHSPNSYAQDQTTLLVLLAAMPVSGLRLEIRPNLARASNLNPKADELNGGWSQSARFLPSNARDWKGVDATVRYEKGPFAVRGFYSLRDSGDAPGLQRRESDDLFVGFNRPAGPWTFRASGRLTHSDLGGTFTTYALPGDPVDPADPTHRLPMGGSWRRQGQSAQTDIQRVVSDLGTLGLLALWDHQVLQTHGVLDQPRHSQLLQAGFFLSRSRGAFGFRAEAGVESYRLQDPVFVPHSPPPGPYLWAGLTERPGTRGYIKLDLTWKF